MLKALNGPEAMNEVVQVRYGTTKLLLIYDVWEIAKLAAADGGKPSVIVNYTCPGATRSDLAREARKTSVGKVLLFFVDAFFSKTT
jgi:retinol dehydrogenase-12